MRNSHKLLLSIFLSLLFIYLIVWKPHLIAVAVGDRSLIAGFFGDSRVNFAHILVILGDIKIWFLIACFALNPLQILIRSHRWTVMIRPLGKLRVRDSISVQMIGYLTSTILPLRMGEVVRGVLLGQRLKIATSRSLASVLTERILDTLSVLVLISLVGVFFPLPHTVREAALGLSIASPLALALVLYFALSRDPFSGWLGRLLAALPGRTGEVIHGFFRSFATGFVIPKGVSSYIIIVFESVALWMVYASQGYLMMLAFGFERDYPLIAAAPFTAAFVILIMNTLGLSLPSAPGGIGTFHAACIFGLSLFEVPMDQAAGYALILHASAMVFYIGFGIPFMWREGIHLNELSQASKLEKESPRN